MAVHKQTAASRSTSPWIKLQHGRVGGDPTTIFTKLSTLAHTPSFKASIGHFPCHPPPPLPESPPFPQVPQLSVPVTRAKNRRLSDKKRVIEAWFFKAMSIR
ncbi:hypothetical protein AABB24_005462 [Solanum stoloniferum]|uniref:Uncharacterized protein n=1 Tax=Solanum stoloniferum TaxID=62892 RepID=A0ABD2UXD5_9SOLN